MIAVLMAPNTLAAEARQHYFMATSEVPGELTMTWETDLPYEMWEIYFWTVDDVFGEDSAGLYVCLSLYGANEECYSDCGDLTVIAGPGEVRALPFDHVKVWVTNGVDFENLRPCAASQGWVHFLAN
jgi:hypothetical protein